MKTALQVFSIISIVLGTLALVQGFIDLGAYVEDAGYSIVGGGFFLVEGILALGYINEVAEETKR